MNTLYKIFEVDSIKPLYIDISNCPMKEFSLFQTAVRYKLAFPFVGTSDKNGTPIFQNDIITSDEFDKMMVDWTGYWYNLVYVDNNGSWDDELEHNWLKEDNLEVIGDMIQNPNIMLIK